MLATAGAPPAGEGWAWEWKHDGMRAIVHTSPTEIRIFSRNGNDVTSCYPELHGALPPREAVFDGEIVACDSAGRPSFAQLQKRMHVGRPASALCTAVPVSLYLFDVLHLDGRKLVDEPYTVRRRLLEELELPEGPASVPANFVGVDGEAMLAAAREHGLEGVVAKRLTSTYLPGRRSAAWVKIPLRRSTDVTIIGWQPGRGRRDGHIGSLIVAVASDEGPLKYAGEVGTGFTDAALADLRRRLAPLQRPDPAADVPRNLLRSGRWVEPVLIGEVQFREQTAEGRLRHPAWRGLRFDVDLPADPSTEGVMGTDDGAWRIVVLRRGGASWYQLHHRGAVVDWLDLEQLHRILGQAGVDLGAFIAA